MGANERKEKEKEIRRTDIIQAAERVFFTKGYDAATMDDVAKEAEFSKRTIYVYFNSKEQIYFEIMVKGYKILISMLKTDMEDKKTANSLDTLRQIGKTLYRFSKEYTDYFKAIMEYENGELDFSREELNKTKEECYELGEKLFSYLTSALEKGIKEGEIRKDLDVVNTAIVLWASVIGVFNTVNKKKNYIMEYHKRKPEELIQAAFDVLVRSIEI
ncbi:TetR/AcrR family transcriptional regulator [Clostridium sp. 19966]|uniref:TetR/AcrR family transcriptional regulator n=1 Tax=Clostridium sp. 19966 TaxID=2768166 RepID=UPI0028DE5F43|nr:TetR/AcrR family transcriptional regulator [Clostridium sp. 19966]MDT8717701.1 TetR/AcrR family transcriptional regulator [Clostridium sp. 19966]